jgi:hypothetical protein
MELDSLVQLILIRLKSQRLLGQNGLSPKAKAIFAEKLIEQKQQDNVRISSDYHL